MARSSRPDAGVGLAQAEPPCPEHCPASAKGRMPCGLGLWGASLVSTCSGVMNHSKRGLLDLQKSLLHVATTIAKQRFVSVSCVSGVRPCAARGTRWPGPKPCARDQCWGFSGATLLVPTAVQVTLCCRAMAPVLQVQDVRRLDMWGGFAWPVLVSITCVMAPIWNTKGSKAVQSSPKGSKTSQGCGQDQRHQESASASSKGCRTGGWFGADSLAAQICQTFCAHGSLAKARGDSERERERDRARETKCRCRMSLVAAGSHPLSFLAF